jgi:hypothetical protein
MTPAEQRAEQLDALAKLRDIRTMADEVIGTLERVLTATAVATPPLIAPERPEWKWSAEAARILGVEKTTMNQRARRGVRTGIARKVGGRWQVRLDLMAPGRVRPAR